MKATFIVTLFAVAFSAPVMAQQAQADVFERYTGGACSVNGVRIEEIRACDELEAKFSAPAQTQRRVAATQAAPQAPTVTYVKPEREWTGGRVLGDTIGALALGLIGNKAGEKIGDSMGHKHGGRAIGSIVGVGLGAKVADELQAPAPVAVVTGGQIAGGQVGYGNAAYVVPQQGTLPVLQVGGYSEYRCDGGKSYYAGRGCLDPVNAERAASQEDFARRAWLKNRAMGL